MLPLARGFDFGVNDPNLVVPAPLDPTVVTASEVRAAASAAPAAIEQVPLYDVMVLGVRAASRPVERATVAGARSTCFGQFK